MLHLNIACVPQHESVKDQIWWAERNWQVTVGRCEPFWHCSSLKH